MVTLGPKLKGQKHTKNYSTTTSEFFYTKSGSKEHLILKKWKEFESCENGHFAKAIARQNGQFGSEINKAKNMPKTTLQPH